MGLTIIETEKYSKQRQYILEDLVKNNGFTHGAELGIATGIVYKHLLSTCSNLYLIGVDLYEVQNNDLSVPGAENYETGSWGLKWDHEKDYAEMLEFTKTTNGRGTVLKMLTSEAAKIVEDSSLDFIFMDAQHTYNALKQDIIDWTPKVKNAGVICGHDYGWGGFPGVDKAVNEIFGHKEITVYKSDSVWMVKK